MAIKDFRIPVHVREDQFGGLTVTLPEASPLRGPAVKGRRYLNQGFEADSLLLELSRGQAYRLRQSGTWGITLRLNDEVICGIFGIDY